MSCLIIPKIGQVWKLRNPEGEITIVGVAIECGYCETVIKFYRFLMIESRSLTFDILNDIAIPPLEAKLDFLIGEHKNENC